MIGNLNTLPSAIGLFDCIIAIDTLYFVKDLENSIREIRKLLKPGGQFAVFYSCKTDAAGDVDQLQANTNKLGKVLSKCHIKFQTWNFTLNQEKVWTLCFKVAEELKEKFEVEGTLDLYKSRIQESQRHLNAISEGRAARFMYHMVL